MGRRSRLPAPSSRSRRTCPDRCSRTPRRRGTPLQGWQYAVKRWPRESNMSSDRTKLKSGDTASQAQDGVKRRDLLLGGTAAVAASALGATSLPKAAQAQQVQPGGNAPATSQLDRSKLPMPEPPFGGRISRTYQDSTGEWPKLPAPPEGATNVVIILLDDVGLGQVSNCCGPDKTTHTGLYDDLW